MEELKRDEPPDFESSEAPEFVELQEGGGGREVAIDPDWSVDHHVLEQLCLTLPSIPIFISKRIGSGRRGESRRGRLEHWHGVGTPWVRAEFDRREPAGTVSENRPLAFGELPQRRQPQTPAINGVQDGVLGEVRGHRLNGRDRRREKLIDDEYGHADRDQPPIDRPSGHSPAATGESGWSSTSGRS